MSQSLTWPCPPSPDRLARASPGCNGWWMRTRCPSRSCCSPPLLGDLFGTRRAYLAGFGVFALASLACGLAPSAAWLVAARVAQGVGAALVVPNSLALLNHATGHNSRAQPMPSGSGPRPVASPSVPAPSPAVCSSPRSDGAAFSWSTCRSARWARHLPLPLRRNRQNRIIAATWICPARGSPFSPCSGSSAP